VAELQPWRNPRPAPQLPEIQARLRPPRVPTWLRAWWPVVLWACFIFTMSTDTFSSEHTASVLEPILRWLDPSLTANQFELIHHIIRKCAHFTEFACCFIAACAATEKGGAGRGASRHFSAPQDIPSWMKFTRRSWSAVQLRLTIPCSTRSAPLRLLLCCGCGSAGGGPRSRRKYPRPTHLLPDTSFGRAQFMEELGKTKARSGYWNGPLTVG